MSMSESPSPATWSTVAALPDHLLLAQTAQLARHEQALQILVLDHLREIEARRLHLTRGYGSLFDYVVHELGYTAAAAWRRIKAMRLCDQTSGARELLQDGSLNLSNAAQLQNLFERSDRSRGRPPGSGGTGGGPGGAPRNDDAPGEPAPAAPVHTGESGPAPVAGPVLDAAAREELVRQAAGKSTREVQQMLAEVDPELAQPSDRMRALAGGRWELKATIDTECRHGLEKLQMLLSHTDPHLTLGGLIARLVRDGLDRYDPARPRGTQGTGGRGSVNGVRTVSKPARRDTETVQQSVVRGRGSDVERQSEVEQGDAPSAAVRDVVPAPSAPKRQPRKPGTAARHRRRHHGNDGTQQRRAHDFGAEARLGSRARQRVTGDGTQQRRAHDFGAEARLGSRARQRVTGDGTEQRRPHHFGAEAPRASRVRSHFPCGGGGRQRAGRFAGEAVYGSRGRQHEVRGGAQQRRAHHFAGEAGRAG